MLSWYVYVYVGRDRFQPEETSQDRVISDMKDNGTLPLHNLESVLNVSGVF